jgi:hypothetical protein
MNMDVLPSRREMIRSVADRWHHQYCVKGVWGYTVSGSAETTYLALKALDPEKATSAEVEAILPRWIDHFCYVCSSYHQPAVRVGYYSESSAIVCMGCVKKALALLELEPTE